MTINTRRVFDLIEIFRTATKSVYSNARAPGIHRVCLYFIGMEACPADKVRFVSQVRTRLFWDQIYQQDWL